MKKHLLTAAATAGILFSALGQASAASATYTVKPGDTLWKISTTHNVSISNLKNWNHLSSNTIYVNQHLSLTSPHTSTATVKAASTSVSKAQQIITEAKKYIGVPYVWGGTTPSGFDCSGYVQYVYAKVGISIPRTTYTQWSTLKPAATPKPGDLVYFKTESTSVSHCGIYLGNNQFINATSSYGIKISDMTSSYWKPIYLGARTAF